jgi:hypothetical protein
MFFYKLLNFFTMTEFWDKPAEKSGKVLAAFLEGLPLVGMHSFKVRKSANFLGVAVLKNRKSVIF